MDAGAVCGVERDLVAVEKDRRTRHAICGQGEEDASVSPNAGRAPRLAPVASRLRLLSPGRMDGEAA
jgi:hypothetical protein